MDNLQIIFLIFFIKSCHPPPPHPPPPTPPPIRTVSSSNEGLQYMLLWKIKENYFESSSKPQEPRWLSWPTDLAVPGSIPAQKEIFSTVNWVPLHTAFHYHPPIVLISTKHPKNPWSSEAPCPGPDQNRLKFFKFR